ncbi:Two componenttranscriptional regulator LuxR family (fragment) [Cupriavidus taiwanensis]|uniref:hypothetical protein n=1 Tax=Cupriavidus taiwanensis TaxID=164546 RepID=UPI000E18C0A7
MLTNDGLLTRIREEGVAAIVGKNEDPAVLRQICLDRIALTRLPATARVNQTIMMALSMVIIAAMVGAKATTAQA